MTIAKIEAEHSQTIANYKMSNSDPGCGIGCGCLIFVVGMVIGLVVFIWTAIFRLVF